MSNTLIFWTGILGVTFFSVASILGGFQFEDYNPISQYISETMAVDTPYGKELRFFGYIPSGVLLAIFSFIGFKIFPPSTMTKIGFYGLGIFYGLGTIIVGIFPCDSGCNKEFIDPSISQIVHNLTGLLTYMFVPISLLLIGYGLRESKVSIALARSAIICGVICGVFNIIFISEPLNNYAGLFQRISEGTILIWIVICSRFIKNI